MTIRFKLDSNSGAFAVLTCTWDSRTGSDVLKASSFRIITEQHIPAIRHGSRSRRREREEVLQGGQRRPCQ